MKNSINKTNVAVIFGGRSVEHDISIITGVQTLNALDKNKYNILPIYLCKEGSFLTSNKFFDINTFKNKDSYVNNKQTKTVMFGLDSWLYAKKGKKFIKLIKLDFVFLATHGGEGENGSLQGYLDLCLLPYSSCSCLSSAVCMNKLITKQILFQNNINIVDYVYITQSDYLADKNCYLEKIENIKFPLIVKPCNLGSSIGISFCKNKSQLKNALSFAFLFDDCVIIEQAVENLKEVNVAVVGNKLNCECSDIEEVILTNSFLTFENKYMGNSSKGIENTSRIIPAEITKEMEEEILQVSKKAYKLLGCSGVVRIDFLINSKTNKIYLNEVNSIPGSLSNYLWKTKKYNFTKLLNVIMQKSLEDFEINKKKVKNFSTNVLTKLPNSNKLFINK